MAMTSEAGSALYDNGTEPEFRELRRRRLRRMLSSVLVLMIGLAVVTVFFGIPAIANPDPPLLALYLASAGLFGFILVWGLALERGRLIFRVTPEGIEGARYGRVSLERLRGIMVEDSDRFIFLRPRGEGSHRPLLAIWKADVANPTKFRNAVEEVIRMADTLNLSPTADRSLPNP